MVLWKQQRVELCAVCFAGFGFCRVLVGGEGKSLKGYYGLQMGEEKEYSRREEKRREGKREARNPTIMCIAAWIWQAHPLYPLILLLNRDEYHDRPTNPVAWWGEGCQKILGGRDVRARGTWLGCTGGGKLAFLTNVLEPDLLPSAKTRGDLPVRFLQSRKSPLEFAEELVKEAREYNGFNLIVADISSKLMVYISNRPKGEPISIQVVSPGLHVLSNAQLDTPWHKAQRLGIRFRDLLMKHDEEEISEKEMADKLMGDTWKADRDRLPNTGYDPEWELNLSSIFVEFETKLGRFGTRSTAAVSVKKNGNARFYEKYLENGVWKEHTVVYNIEKMMQ